MSDALVVILGCGLIAAGSHVIYRVLRWVLWTRPYSERRWREGSPFHTRSTMMIDPASGKLYGGTAPTYHHDGYKGPGVLGWFARGCIGGAVLLLWAAALAEGNA